jgi:hypothetical protein
MLRNLLIFTAILVLPAFCWAQQKEKKEATAASDQQTYRASPAYAEIVLRRTELSSNLESLVLEYTEEFPKVKELRQTLVLLDRESARLAKVKAPEAGKLTLALGKLIVRKVELEIEVWTLQRTYKDEHPDVKRAMRKVEIYETAIGEILN